MSSRDPNVPHVPEREQGGDGSHPAPEETQHPVPGVEHKPEPDAENIMPAEDQPGTL
jgi:hypothetical protein